jgi:hypothetical protein
LRLYFFSKQARGREMSALIVESVLRSWWLVPLASMVVIVSGVLLHRARRHRAALANALREVDECPPVLLLRSFADDARTLPSSRFLFRRFPNIFSRLTLEQFVAEQFAVEGPVITIGEPHEKLPRLGAARAYFADMEWQGAVTLDGGSESYSRRGECDAESPLGTKHRDRTQSADEDLADPSTAPGEET